MFRSRQTVVGLGMSLVLVAAGCRLERRLVSPADVTSLDRESHYLKAHLRNGELFVLEHWGIGGGIVHGVGERYDENRSVLEKGVLSFLVTDVVLFETNKPVANTGVVAALTVVTVASLAATGFCLANPKACFGSCPTFYAQDAGGRERLVAEAFSASVAPALEATDVDALFRADTTGGAFKLRVTNEALETHVIRDVHVLAARRPPGGRVVAASDGGLWQARSWHPPTRCRAAEGDCLPAIAALDDRERHTESDGRDLAARETIDLEFAAPPTGALGLVIEARQTFITTYLFYQALAYMGRQAGSYLAALERGDPKLRQRAASLHHLLGGIEVQVPDGRGGWSPAGAFDETGPIASDLQLVPLPPALTGGSQRIRLRLTRGHWRLGHVALVTLGDRVTPARIRPRAVKTLAGDGDRARLWLAGKADALVTLPGDAHELGFELPEAGPDGLDLFLESRGYYLEWMREPWLKEESAAKLALLFEMPSLALERLAPEYKALEPNIEALFWNSRYEAPRAR